MTRSADRSAAALPVAPAGERRFGDAVLGWRDRLLASPGFHRLASRLPILRPIARRQSRRLFDLVAGFVYSQVLFACVQLRLLDHLAEGPLEVDDIGRLTGLPAEAARRLCGAAASLGLLDRRGRSRFGLGLLGAAMLGNPGIAAMVAHHGALYGDLADPAALLRAGRGARLPVFWSYGEGDAPSDEGEVEPYTKLMSASQPLVAEQILDAYPVGRHRQLLDVGGGDGSFLVAASRRAPELRLVLFDLPPVAEFATRRFARHGLADRASSLGGDLRTDKLPAGSDLLSLVRVIHDHDDGAALAILTKARAALPPGGTLLVAEPLAETQGAEAVEAYFAFYLLAMGSGRPRSRRELSVLLTQAGFHDVRQHRTANPLLVSVLAAKNPRQRLS